MSDPLAESIEARAYDTRTAEARKLIYSEISRERIAQIHKWGRENQTHPHMSFGGQRQAYWEFCEGLAKSYCDKLTQKTVTWEDILYEEVCEALATPEWSERRKELIQAAAVIVAEIEDGDFKNGA